MEINVEKSKVMRISMQQSAIQILINEKQKIWNIPTIFEALKQIIQDVHVTINPGLPR
jgi:hypothetical protein